MEDIEAKVAALGEWGADPNAAIRRMLGDEELFFGLLNSFIDGSDWKLLGDLLENKSLEDAFVIAHRMKGSAADLSLGPLFESLCIVTDDLRGEVSSSLSEDVKSLMMIRASLKDVMK